MASRKSIVLTILFISSLVSYLIFTTFTTNDASLSVPPPHPFGSSPTSASISSSKAKSSRVTYLLSEVNTINRLLIDKQNLCSHQNGNNSYLMIFVFSAPNNIDRRQAIRQTWGNYAHKQGINLLFIIGKSVIKSEMDTIKKENRIFNDILQGSFIDSYNNLTLKTMTMIKWVADNCSNVKYIFKSDDDMLINMRRVILFAKSTNYKETIIGRLAKAWPPIRDPESKYFLSKNEYDKQIYPNFVTGPSYFFTGDSADLLITRALKLTPIHLEDVFITGIVAESAKIDRVNHKEISNIHHKITPCVFDKIISSHDYKPDKLIAIWNYLQRAKCKV